MLGTGEVPTSALATGALPSGVTIAGNQVTSSVPTADAASGTTFSLGNGWVIETTTAGLVFTHDGTDVFSIADNGAIVSANDVTAFGTVIPTP